MVKFRLFLSLALVLSLATVGMAQDETKKKAKGKNKMVTQLTNQTMRAFKAAELTDEQKEKATEIVKNHVEEMSAAKKALDGLLSDDQKAARKAAFAANKEAGLKGKEATAAMHKALGLSDEKLAEYKEASKKPQAIQKKIKAAIMELLTEDQIAAMPKKKGKGKKKDATAGTQAVSLKLPNMT